MNSIADRTPELFHVKQRCMVTKHPNLFGDSYASRMLRWMIEREPTPQADFMREYHRIGAKGGTFLNNFGRFTRGDNPLMKVSPIPPRARKDGTPRMRRNYRRSLLEIRDGTARYRDELVPVESSRNLITWVGPTVKEWIAACDQRAAFSSMEDIWLRAAACGDEEMFDHATKWIDLLKGFV